jgi:enoyl-CoA hydratase/carnithine racemase
VLASDSRVFIAGADLREIMGLTDPDLHEYLRFGQRVYGRIASLPCTTVAAINGAVLGGGLEIAMHCDLLIAAQPTSASPDKPAKPYAIGLPEAGLSICPGWGGTNMLPARMDPVRAIRMTATGQPFSIIDAVEAGLVEELVSPEGLIDRAKILAARPKHKAGARPRCIEDPEYRDRARAAFAHLAAELPATQAARAVAECVRIGLDKGWRAALDAEREHLVRLRGTPEGRRAIEAFFAKGRQ